MTIDRPTEYFVPLLQHVSTLRIFTIWNEDKNAGLPVWSHDLSDNRTQGSMV